MPISDLLAELKRRRVFRVVAVYAVVAFGIAQVLDVVVEPLRLPEWTMTLAVVLLLLGFPIAVVLAWAFDLTPDGVKRATTAEAATSPVTNRAAYVGLGVLIALVGFGGYAYLGPGIHHGAPGEGPIGSIAVLPFVDMSEAGDQAYFSDGLSEELLDGLAKVDGLRVAARTSSFAFRGKNEDVREIGRQLDVAAVLEGSVRRAGDRVRVTAQLIDVASGYHILSEQYDRELTDVFALQDDLTRAILDRLRVELGGAAPATTASVDPRAHDLYLRGLQEWHARGLALDSALAHFRAATEIAPAYAKAWEGLALTYAVIPVHRAFDGDVARREGEAAARRALELDSGSAAAHAALGQIAANIAWDWATAEREYRTALELNPNDATTHQWLAETYFKTGRLDAADAEMNRALLLDPLAGVAHFMRATLVSLRGRTDDALAELRRARELSPSMINAAGFEWEILVDLHRFDEAAALLPLFARDSAHASAFTAVAAAIDDRAARPRAVAAIRDRMESLANAATLSMLIGDDARALDYLEQALAERAPSLPDFLGTVAFARLTDAPRFRRVVQATHMEGLYDSPAFRRILTSYADATANRPL